MFNRPYSKRLPSLADIQKRQSFHQAMPSINGWVVAGGWFLLTTLVGSAALTTVVKYKTLVRAPMTVRPEGELSVVQSAVEGSVVNVAVEVNQKVRRGQLIATIDDSTLKIRQNQLQESIEEIQTQLDHIDTQIVLLERQIGTEETQVATTIEIAQAELAGIQWQYSDERLTAEASIREAEAALILAQEEFARYQQLVEQGAVAPLELSQKRTAVEVAAAQLDKLSVALNPTVANITVAREKIDQVRSQGAVKLSQLRQTQSQLMQQRSALNSDLLNNKQNLRQTLNDLEDISIKAPVSGTIQSLSLRNSDQVLQPGEQIASIFPDGARLKIQAVVPAKEISKVEVGQEAQMRLSSCPFSQFGTLPGIVSNISPDAVVNSNDKASAKQADSAFYSVTIRPHIPALESKEKTCLLQSGLEGRADIIAREETVFDFILRKASLTVGG